MLILLLFQLKVKGSVWVYIYTYILYNFMSYNKNWVNFTDKVPTGMDCSWLIYQFPFSLPTFYCLSLSLISLIDCRSTRHTLYGFIVLNEIRTWCSSFCIRVDLMLIFTPPKLAFDQAIIYYKKKYEKNTSSTRFTADFETKITFVSSWHIIY